MASSSIPPTTNSEAVQPDPTVTSSNDNENIIKKKRKKTSKVWEDFVEIEKNGEIKAMCKWCHADFSIRGSGASTSHLKRHIDERCNVKKKSIEARQSTIPFKPINPGVNPFMEQGGRYSNEKMREVIATAIMIHEYPFSIVEDEAWMWAFQYANAEFQKVGRKTARSDCLAIYETEKKRLKTLLESVSKISLTTDMWKSSHQVVEYMVITGHFIDSEWNLQKRVLNFAKVPAPRRGIDVADAIFKCLRG